MKFFLKTLFVIMLTTTNSFSVGWRVVEQMGSLALESRTTLRLVKHKSVPQMNKASTPLKLEPKVSLRQDKTSVINSNLARKEFNSFDHRLTNVSNKKIGISSVPISRSFMNLANSLSANSSFLNYSSATCAPFIQKCMYSSSSKSENDNPIREEKMKSLLFVINDAPYGNERAYNALRLAGAVINKEGLHVRLFLMADTVSCAKAGQKVPEGYYNIQLMLSKVIRKGEVGLCGTCMDARGLTEAELIEGAKRSTLAQLADWTVEADKVLIY